MLENDVAGRATFLVHGENDGNAETQASDAGPGAPDSVEGLVALKDCVRVLNGFGTSLEGMLPKLRDGYIAQDAATARRLASEHPHGFFLSPSGEAFHNATVTGGRARAQGPLALKRELSEVQQKLDATVAELAQAELEAARLEREVRELSLVLEAKTQERRDAARVGELGCGVAADGTGDGAH
jgi:chromosome segregation protein